MAGQLTSIGRFKSSVEALHAANKAHFCIAGIRRWNRLLIETKEYMDTVRDERGFVGSPCLQEAKGKPFGKFVETEISINSHKALLVAPVGREFIGRADLVLFCDHSFEGKIASMQLVDAQGKEIGQLDGQAVIFAKYNAAVYSVEAKERWGTDFSVGDGHALRLFTKDNAFFGLPVRCYDFCNRRGVVAGVQAHEPFDAFGHFEDAAVL